MVHVGPTLAPVATLAKQPDFVADLTDIIGAAVIRPPRSGYVLGKHALRLDGPRPRHREHQIGCRQRPSLHALPFHSVAMPAVESVTASCEHTQFEYFFSHLNFTPS